MRDDHVAPPPLSFQRVAAAPSSATCPGSEHHQKHGAEGPCRRERRPAEFARREMLGRFVRLLAHDLGKVAGSRRLQLADLDSRIPGVGVAAVHDAGALEHATLRAVTEIGRSVELTNGRIGSGGAVAAGDVAHRPQLSVVALG